MYEDEIEYFNEWDDEDFYDATFDEELAEFRQVKWFRAMFAEKKS